MLVKVCGMREPMNIRDLAQLRIDMIGFIFYKKSSRYVEENAQDKAALLAPIIDITGLNAIPKVGVFVDAPLEYVLEKAKEYALTYVQLHGEESIFYGQQLKDQGLKIIKAFSVDSSFNFTQTTAYSFSCDYFLFDTKGSKPGGNGFSFDWKVLEKYQGDTPFLLSGGLGPESIPALQNFKHPQWAGIDLNSRFESAPGKKDLIQIHQFLTGLREAQVLKTELPNWD